VARDLAALGHRRFRQGRPLNVRRREKVRRYLSEAGEELGWDEVVALSDDPVSVVSKDVKRMLRSGVRSLSKGVEEELARKKKEAPRLEMVVARVEELAEDPDAFPAEIEYEHAGEFGLVVHQRNQLPGHVDVAAGDRERVVDLAVEQRHGEGRLRIGQTRLQGDVPADLLDVGGLRAGHRPAELVEQLLVILGTLLRLGRHRNCTKVQ